ncbi:hypothetical protein CH25_gp52 [Mycobacterium phage EagleEye]|uniref:Uncharacterized protein n=1 Tax=Mycobacterium phage EagleEye TaxID=1429759 RepID=W0LMR2_9CAUD|nr:hypothetical protein CH25_gp52 [Mycobacterium phage EagleEye]AHG23834.1 hypothetical protein PBI_EAGLEEYE_54 [Mycobacterium phage EagleEye]QDK03487.1 hypothetical protein SEA_LUCYEDI_53 [Mycobacterium phage Lucyedi]QNJ55838.1 hypothetical protein SEA_PAINTERBOY_53 [Mycobacterium phage PainterBoy]
MKVGDKVTVERDEEKYPDRGTWSWFRGKKGVITGIAGSEIGVSFSGGSSADAYFKPYELTERNK